MRRAGTFSSGTRAQLRRQLTDLVRTLSLPDLLARIDQAARTIHGHVPADARTSADFASFDEHLPEAKAAITRIKTYQLPPF